MDKSSIQELKKTPSRFRSTSFRKEEVDCLLDLIEQNKAVLSLSSSAAACQTKDLTWAKIARIFNSRGFRAQRSIDSLRCKWTNLKSDVRNLAKNVLSDTFDETHENNHQLNRVLALVCEGNKMNIDMPLEVAIEVEDLKDSKSEENVWSQPLEEHQPDNNSEDSDDNEQRVRSMNFSPAECKLLLQCVKKEMDILLDKGTTAQAVQIKNEAWNRVEEQFNSLSPRQRTVKMLKNKFNNMKTNAKKVGFKGEMKQLASRMQNDDNIPLKKIKAEPNPHRESIDVSNDDRSWEFQINVENGKTIDPLEAVLHNTSDMPWNQPESKEVVRLKTELLNYQLENAKLDRQRIQDAIESEKSERESKAILMSLELRKARLEMAAAEAKFPPDHHLLMYTQAEARARDYLQNE